MRQRRSLRRFCNQRSALKQVCAKRFIEVRAGPATRVIYLTRGAKPKVAGVASQ